MPQELILVVEDEPNIREIVTLYLQRAGFQVHALDNGHQAQQWLNNQLPDLIILDLMLPEIDGYQLTVEIRARSDVPIIMLTSRRGEVDRIAGLEMGADDYVVKPFSPQELVSRVRAVLRRSRPKAGEAPETILEIGTLIIDPNSRQVTVRDQACVLTAREFDLLHLLAANPRRVFSRDQLLERVWGSSEYIDPGTVTVHIRRLREKIETEASQPEHILTVWGVGYRFEP
ncbi:MAG: response regulator transcription factor [Anaerolineales bacterium]|nr:MAG: response regulator transcription factor [Anaerolineales bacterium]